MKLTKKNAAMLLLIALALLLTGVSFADESGGSITVNNALPGRVYNLYRIFEPGNSNADNAPYSFCVTGKWAKFARNSPAFVRVDQRGLVSWNENADKSAFAQSALIYAEANNIKPSYSSKSESSCLEFNGLEMGCYLVDSSLGSLCTLSLFSSSQEVYEQNSVPLLSCSVMDGNIWEKSCNAHVGDFVRFKTDISAKRGMQALIINNIMPEGISFRQLNSITLNNTAVSAKSYSAEIIENGLRISFYEDFCENLKNDDKLSICFTAFVDSDSLLGHPGNCTTTSLDYGSGRLSEKTMLYVWEFNIIKFSSDAADSGPTPRLVLSHNGSTVKLSQIDRTQSFRIDPAGNVTQINAASFDLIGLDSGIYHLYKLNNEGQYTSLSSFTVSEKGKLSKKTSYSDAENIQLSINSRIAENQNNGKNIHIFILAAVLSLVLLGASLTVILSKIAF